MLLAKLEEGSSSRHRATSLAPASPLPESGPHRPRSESIHSPSTGGIRWRSHQSSAGPGAASGRRRPSRDCAGLADGEDPCRRRARPRSRKGTPPRRRYGRVSSGGPLGQIRFGVGRDLLIRCLPNSLGASESPGPGRACPRAPAANRRICVTTEGVFGGRDAPGSRRPSWPRPGRILVSRVTRSGSGLPPRALAARGCAGCIHRNRYNAEAFRPGWARLAGRRITIPS